MKGLRSQTLRARAVLCCVEPPVYAPRRPESLRRRAAKDQMQTGREAGDRTLFIFLQSTYLGTRSIQKKKKRRGGKYSLSSPSASRVSCLSLSLSIFYKNGPGARTEPCPHAPSHYITRPQARVPTPHTHTPRAHTCRCSPRSRGAAFGCASKAGSVGRGDGSRRVYCGDMGMGGSQTEGK